MLVFFVRCDIFKLALKGSANSVVFWGGYQEGSEDE